MLADAAPLRVLARLLVSPGSVSYNIIRLFITGSY